MQSFFLLLLPVILRTQAPDMRTFIKFDYLSFYSGGLSYHSIEPIPIFKDMNTLYAIGYCQLVKRLDTHRQRPHYYGVVESDEAFDPALHFYYLRDEDDRWNLSFQGINLSTKRLTNYYYWKWRWRFYLYRLVITEPPYLWQHLVIDEIPDWKEGTVVKMW